MRGETSPKHRPGRSPGCDEGVGRGALLLLDFLKQRAEPTHPTLPGSCSALCPLLHPHSSSFSPVPQILTAVLSSPRWSCPAHGFFSCKEFLARKLQLHHPGVSWDGSKCHQSPTNPTMQPGGTQVPAHPPCLGVHSQSGSSGNFMHFFAIQQ